jgi:hypothetical protein
MRNELRLLARHEAGHALVLWIYGGELRGDGLSIDSAVGAKHKGRGVCDAAALMEYQNIRLGLLGMTKRAAMRRIRAEFHFRLAGGIAEAHERGITGLPDSAFIDKWCIDNCFTEIAGVCGWSDERIQARYERLYAQVERLLRIPLNAAALETLTEELVRRTTITPAEFTAIMELTRVRRKALPKVSYLLPGEY